jgi:hypothetical protein
MNMRFFKKIPFPIIALAIAVFFASAHLAAAEKPAAPEGCTSIEVGRLATVDGSVITCHTCDGPYRTWVNIVPHQKWPEKTMNKIYSGRMHTETPPDLQGVLQTGEIPQVPETYRFLNTAYPCLNEQGLAIGETTIGGRQELVNNEGVFMIEELERVMLERSKTAREAIRLAGELVKTYGYGDFGECITVADGKEVWHFEIFGAGPLEKGAVWAAVRIPDDHVGISANIPRISELDLKDPDHYMASENVFQVARDMGWYDPKGGEPFKFWKAYSGRRPFSTREFFVLSTLAPSLKLTMDMPELPFSVKPEKKVSVRDILAIYRDPYEGTDLDMTKNLLVPKRMGRRDPGAGAEPHRQRLDAPRRRPAHQHAEARDDQLAPDHSHLRVRLRDGHPGPGLAAARRGSHLLVLLRQSCDERPHPHLRRHDRAPARLRGLRSAPVPAGFCGLGLPASQPPGHSEMGDDEGPSPGDGRRVRGQGLRRPPSHRKEGPGDPGEQDARERALHRRSVLDQVHERLRPGGGPKIPRAR